MNRQNKSSLLVTTGDDDGIGFEVSVKALVKLPKSFFRTTDIFIFVTDSFEKKYFSILKKYFTIISVKLSSSDFSLAHARSFLIPQLSKSKKPLLYFIICTDAPPSWIYNLSKICLNEPKSVALVTGPLSKTLIKTSGYSAVGHTEILADVSKSKDLFMGFVGKYFSVVLLTGHIPLKDVSITISKLNWDRVVGALSLFISDLPFAKKPAGLLGLNPHAGESGLISGGEDEYLKNVVQKLNASPHTSFKVEGPLVPDAAFLKVNWRRYCVYLCGYHDQGLIPFKAIHGQDSGVHVTLGLPFVRTSVDHGTAKDIFGKNRANPNSMKDALLLAKKLLKRKLLS